MILVLTKNDSRSHREWFSFFLLLRRIINKPLGAYAHTGILRLRHKQYVDTVMCRIVTRLMRLAQCVVGERRL